MRARVAQARCKALVPGVSLICVQGTPTLGLRFDDVLQLIRSASRPLTLGFAAPTAATRAAAVGGGRTVAESAKGSADKRGSASGDRAISGGREGDRSSELQHAPAATPAAVPTAPPVATSTPPMLDAREDDLSSIIAMDAAKDNPLPDIKLGLQARQPLLSVPIPRGFPVLARMTCGWAGALVAGVNRVMCAPRARRACLG